MVTTLTGANSFGWQARLRELTATFIEAEGDLALERLDGSEAELPKIREALHSLPFLASKKMVVLREPSANKMFSDDIEHILADLPETTDAIIVEPKLDKRLSYYKYLKKQTDFQEFNEFDQNGLAHWLTEAAKAKQGTISTNDARYLVERVGASQQLLSSELEKLLLFNPTITKQIIDELTEATPQSTIFQLLEAAFAGNIKKALALYDEQRALKVEPQSIIGLITWQLHILALLQTAGNRSTHDIAQATKIKPFTLQKSQPIARKLNLVKLIKLIEQLCDIDKKSKQTSIDVDEALQNYILKLKV